MINTKPFKRYFSKIILCNPCLSLLKSNRFISKPIKSFCVDPTKENKLSNDKVEIPPEQANKKDHIRHSNIFTLDEMYVDHPSEILGLTCFLNNFTYDLGKVYSFARVVEKAEDLITIRITKEFKEFVNHFRRDLEGIEKVPKEYIFPMYYLFIVLKERDILKDMDKEIIAKIDDEIAYSLRSEVKILISREKLFLLSLYLKHHFVDDISSYNNIDKLGSIDMIRILLNLSELNEHSINHLPLVHLITNKLKEEYSDLSFENKCYFLYTLSRINDKLEIKTHSTYISKKLYLLTNHIELTIPNMRNILLSITKDITIDPLNDITVSFNELFYINSIEKLERIHSLFIFDYLDCLGHLLRNRIQLPNFNRIDLYLKKYYHLLRIHYDTKYFLFEKHQFKQFINVLYLLRNTSSKGDIFEIDMVAFITKNILDDEMRNCEFLNTVFRKDDFKIIANISNETCMKDKCLKTKLICVTQLVYYCPHLMEDHIKGMLKNIMEEINTLTESHQYHKLADSIIYYIDNLQKLLDCDNKIKDHINNMFKDKFYFLLKHFKIHPIKIKLLYCLHNFDLSNHDELYELRNKIGKVLLENKDFFILDYYKFVFSNNERKNPYFETFVYYLEDIKDLSELYNRKNDMKYIITIAISSAIQCTEGLVPSNIYFNKEIVVEKLKTFVEKLIIEELDYTFIERLQLLNHYYTLNGHQSTLISDLLLQEDTPLERIDLTSAIKDNFFNESQKIDILKRLIEKLNKQDIKLPFNRSKHYLLLLESAKLGLIEKSSLKNHLLSLGRDTLKEREIINLIVKCYEYEVINTEEFRSILEKVYEQNNFSLGYNLDYEAIYNCGLNEIIMEIGKKHLNLEKKMINTFPELLEQCISLKSKDLDIFKEILSIYIKKCGKNNSTFFNYQMIRILSKVDLVSDLNFGSILSRMDIDYLLIEDRFELFLCLVKAGERSSYFLKRIYESKLLKLSNPKRVYMLLESLPYYIKLNDQTGEYEINTLIAEINNSNLNELKFSLKQELGFLMNLEYFPLLNKKVQAIIENANERRVQYYLSDILFMTIVTSIKLMGYKIEVFPKSAPCHLIESKEHKFAVLLRRFTDDSLLFNICREKTTKITSIIIIIDEIELKSVYNYSDVNTDKVIKYLQSKGLVLNEIDIQKL